MGLSAEQIAQLPEGILGFPRTDNVNQLIPIYTMADVFVNPSREETFGLTVVEAMACGTWPIVYAGTACAEIVEQAVGQIVSGGVCELREAIQAHRAQGSLENIDEYAKLFSKEHFGEEMLAIYENRESKQ